MIAVLEAKVVGFAVRFLETKFRVQTAAINIHMKQYFYLETWVSCTTRIQTET